MQNYKFIVLQVFLCLLALMVFQFFMMAILDDPLLHRLLD